MSEQSEKVRENLTSVPASDAERVIAAISEGYLSPGATDARVRAVLARVRPMFGEDTEFQMYLGIQLDRQPAPLLLDRIWFGEVYDGLEPRPVQMVQKNVDAFGRVMQGRVARARLSRNRPFTSPMESLLGNELSERVRCEHLKPLGFHHLIISDWISSEERLVTLHVLRKQQEPFGSRECALCSMLMLGLAPMIDHHATQRSPGPVSRMSRGQLQLLRAILTGHEASPSESLSRLLGLYGATSQHDLTARFIPSSAIEEIDEALRLIDLEASDN